MNLIDKYGGFVLDLDGTVYLGDDLLPGAADTIAAIRRAKKPIVYLTNKPLEPSSEYADKLTRLGLETDSADVVSSLDGLVSYMTSVHDGARVICVTEQLVSQTLRAAGFGILPLEEAEQADVVVVSFDRTFDYLKLHAAFRAVRAGAVIVATNPDPYCPTPEGGLPDCAAMLAAIEASTGTKAEVVLGKPSPLMIQTVLERIDVPREGLLMVGDRVGTDVVMAHAADVDSALVLTGATTRDEALAFDPAPKYLLDDLSGLLEQQPVANYQKGF